MHSFDKQTNGAILPKSGVVVRKSGGKIPLTRFALCQIVLIQRLPPQRFYHRLPADVQFTGYAIKLLKHLDSKIYIYSLRRIFHFLFIRESFEISFPLSVRSAISCRRKK
jgi:hypothetical protein